MKKVPFVFSFLVVFMLLTCLLLFPVVALHASEEKGAEAPKAEKSEGGEKGEKKDKKPSANEVVSGGRFSGDPIYVHLRPMYMPVVTESGAEQIVTLMVDLRVQDMNIANSFQDNMPRVRDALMQVLYGGLSNGSLRNGGLIDVVKVKEKIGKAIGKVMGEDAVQEVLIQAIAQRKM